MGPLLALLGCAPEAPLTPPITDPQPHCVIADSETDADTDLDYDVAFPDPNTPGVDYDCDGWPNGTGPNDDCDDQDPDVHPGATEYNNARDDDCDGDPEPLYGCGVTSYESEASGARVQYAMLPAAWWLLARRRRR